MEQRSRRPLSIEGLAETVRAGNPEGVRFMIREHPERFLRMLGVNYKERVKGSVFNVLVSYDAESPAAKELFAFVFPPGIPSPLCSGDIGAFRNLVGEAAALCLENCGKALVTGNGDTFDLYRSFLPSILSCLEKLAGNTIARGKNYSLDVSGIMEAPFQWNTNTLSDSDREGFYTVLREMALRDGKLRFVLDTLLEVASAIPEPENTDFHLFLLSAVWGAFLKQSPDLPDDFFDLFDKAMNCRGYRRTQRFLSVFASKSFLPKHFFSSGSERITQSVIQEINNSPREDFAMASKILSMSDARVRSENVLSLSNLLKNWTFSPVRGRFDPVSAVLKARRIISALGEKMGMENLVSGTPFSGNDQDDDTEEQKKKRVVLSAQNAVRNSLCLWGAPANLSSNFMIASLGTSVPDDDSGWFEGERDRLPLLEMVLEILPEDLLADMFSPANRDFALDLAAETLRRWSTFSPGRGRIYNEIKSVDSINSAGKLTEETKAGIRNAISVLVQTISNILGRDKILLWLYPKGEDNPEKNTWDIPKNIPPFNDKCTYFLAAAYFDDGVREAMRTMDAKTAAECFAEDPDENGYDMGDADERLYM